MVICNVPEYVLLGLGIDGDSWELISCKFGLTRSRRFCMRDSVIRWWWVLIGFNRVELRWTSSCLVLSIKSIQSWRW
jgi:hypothetical protein